MKALMTYSNLREKGEFTKLAAEIVRGRKHGPYNSTHEALGVILEEFEEFKVEVFRNDTPAAVAEARQVAATALRFCIEFGGQNDGQTTDRPVA